MPTLSEPMQAPALANLDLAHDEMVTGQGGVRPHWQTLLSAVNSLPGNGLAERTDNARKLLAEDGALYNAYADPRGAGRHWQFDLLPVILTAEEWDGIEAGLQQRARLLNALLADIYGRQRLLHEGLLPPALVFPNPDFLRPVRDPDMPPTAMLQCYAADLVRLPDGGWRVLADRTELAAGIGYALENRRVLARTMPEIFRSQPVTPLRPFFDLWQNALQNLVSPARASPHMALLTPGPEHDAYFEHVYLARALGLTPVEGADLAARDGSVALKTLDGLKPIDVLLRRVESGLCDPLELNSASTDGVVGMLQVARSGQLALANGIGSGVLETPALAPFLPALCRHLLGEELKLPHVPTLWCGQASALEEVIGGFEGFAIRRCFGRRQEPVLPAALDLGERKALIDRMRRHPAAYVAQRLVAPSLAPTWSSKGLMPHPIIVRGFLVRDGADYQAMPGGHARVPMTHGEFFRSPLQHHGIGKDVWVLSAEDTRVAGAAAAAPQRLAPDRTGAVLPSRAADNLFWLGRYVERLDNGARLLRAGLGRLATGTLGPRDMAELRALAHSLETFSLIDTTAAQAPPDSRVLAQALTQAAGPDQPLQDTFHAIQRLAASVRDRLSADMWHAVNQMLGQARPRLAQGFGDIDRLIAALDELIRFAATFAGLASENMTRGPGWRFLDIGRRIERGIYVGQGALGAFALKPVAWEPALRLALELCDSTITYRSRYLAALQPAPVLDLVLADDSNPRSLAYQLRRLDEHLAGLPKRPGELTVLPVSQIATDLNAVVRMFDRGDAVRQSEGLPLSMLRDLLDESAHGLRALSNAITRAYFTHVPAAQALGSQRAAMSLA
ncbi:MAG: circularly permuted type 2 ATP-grasp protein [Reyranellaceae bacterium]